MNSEFALAVHSLVLLAYDPHKMLSSSEIAKSVSLHPVRVRRVLSLLKKKGYIDSKEGVKGGFNLNCNPENVTLAEIYQLTTRNVLKPKCHTCSGCCPVGKNIEDVLDDIFNEADNSVQIFLRGYTLAMILDTLHSK